MISFRTPRLPSRKKLVRAFERDAVSFEVGMYRVDTCYITSANDGDLWGYVSFRGFAPREQSLCTLALAITLAGDIRHNGNPSSREEGLKRWDEAPSFDRQVWDEWGLLRREGLLPTDANWNSVAG